MDIKQRMNIAQEIGAIRGILNELSVLELVSETVCELTTTIEATRVSRKRVMELLERLEGNVLFVHNVHSRALQEHFWVARACVRG